MESQIRMRLYGIVNDSIVDGPGLRYTIFTQGCPHHCIGCHNSRSHDFNGGYIKDIQEILDEIEENPLLDGVTLSGGEPFCQVEPLIELVKHLKQKKMHIMIYSGYTFEQLMQMNNNVQELLKLCDTLVDGPFVLENRSLSLLYKGSSNQRIIDIQASLKGNQVVLQNINEYGQFI